MRELRPALGAGDELVKVHREEESGPTARIDSIQKGIGRKHICFQQLYARHAGGLGALASLAECRSRTIHSVTRERVVARTEPQDKLFHIQVGPFASRKDAEAMRQRLLADGYNAIVK